VTGSIPRQVACQQKCTRKKKDRASDNLHGSETPWIIAVAESFDDQHIPSNNSMATQRLHWVGDGGRRDLA